MLITQTDCFYTVTEGVRKIALVERRTGRFVYCDKFFSKAKIKSVIREIENKGMVQTEGFDIDDDKILSKKRIGK